MQFESWDGHFTKINLEITQNLFFKNQCHWKIISRISIGQKKVILNYINAKFFINKNANPSTNGGWQHWKRTKYKKERSRWPAWCRNSTKAQHMYFIDDYVKFYVYTVHKIELCQNTIIFSWIATCMMGFLRVLYWTKLRA